MYQSIDNLDSNSNSFLVNFGESRVLKIVLSITATVLLVPVILGNGVPEGRFGGSSNLDIACREIGFIDGILEVDDVEIITGVKFLEGDAFHVTVVPPHIGEWHTSLCWLPVGSIPVVVLTDVIGCCEGNQENENNGFHLN